jgi:hypothetical protein
MDHHLPAIEEASSKPEREIDRFIGEFGGHCIWIIGYGVPLSAFNSTFRDGESQLTHGDALKTRT